MDLRVYHSMLPDITYNSTRIHRVISSAYDGAGLISVNHLLRYDEDREYIGYDINSAYQSVLLENFYPEGEVFHKDNITIPYSDLLSFIGDRLYVAYVEVRNLKSKFEEYEMIAYKSFLDYKNGVWFGWMNNVDIENMNELYDCNIIVKALLVFMNKVKLSDNLKNYIIDTYNEIHKMPKGKERKEKKLEFNILTYGKNAQRRYTQTGEENGLRAKYTHIAMYQAAYTRRRIIDLLKKYKDYIIYTDTDSCYIDADANFNEPISDKIGEFKVEQEKCKLYIFRYKGYIIYNLDGSIRVQKVAGINTQLKPEEIETIKKGGVVEANVTLPDGEKQLVKVYDKLTYGVKIFI